MGLIAPNAAHGCMHPVPKIAGAAAAVLAFFQMMMGSVAGALVSQLYDGATATAMTSLMMIFVVASVATYVLVVHPSEVET
jgi:hypothetical protein